MYLRQCLTFLRCNFRCTNKYGLIGFNMNQNVSVQSNKDRDGYPRLFDLWRSLVYDKKMSRIAMVIQ